MASRLKTKKPLARGTKPLKRGTKELKRATKPLKSRTPLRNKAPLKRRRPAAKRKGKKSVSRIRELLPPRAVLIDRLDGRTSLIVRIRQKVCVTCRRGADLTCSHIFRRRVTDTRFDIDEGGNCVVQCSRCNEIHSLRPQVLFGWFIRMFGLSRFEALRERWQRDQYIQEHELAAKLENYDLIIKAIPADQIRAARERALQV